jgi:phosphoribosylaminoimidazolecarboxamide formyltransferase/IMP cyclohydrolase
VDFRQRLVYWEDEENLMADTTGIALLSVYDKTGIVDFARGLVELGWQVYASGGTARAVSEAGIEVSDVSSLVGGDAILGHRVVTLSREISAGLLADKASSEDVAEMAQLGLPIIDLVCVDMYPIEEAITKAGSSRADVVLQTDIGGPTMLRSAAKGRRIVLSHASQRALVLDWLKNGQPDEAAFLDQLCARAEYEVARYVSVSANYLGDKNVTGLPVKIHVPTKYGENPQQAEAAFYADNRVASDPLGLDQFEHVQGMARSFINMTDIDRLLQTVTHIAAGFARNFGDVPFIAVGVKHGNACGVAVATSAVEAVQNMLEGDTRAIFGGVIMLNAAIDMDVAEALMHYAMDDDRARLLDGVVGASVTPEALKLLSRNKLRVVINPALATLNEASLDTSRRQRPVRGGVLEQPNYDFILDFSADYVQQHGGLSDQQKRDMVLGWAVGCTSNSNTISLVKNGQLIGNGVGQQDRVGAGQLALTRTTIALPELEEQGENIVLRVTLNKAKLSGAVAYSDSFFPFPDGPSLLASAGIKAILTTSGSVADDTVVTALTGQGVSLLMIPDKVGRGFYLH